MKGCAMKTSYYNNRLLDPRKHYVVQISQSEPRFGHKPEAELPDLAPMDHVRELADQGPEVFAEAYFAQLEELSLRSLRRALAEIERFAREEGKEAVLCCFEGLKKPGQYCHRRMFADWYRQKTGTTIPELGQEAEPGPSTPATLKAISLRQPWAWLVLHGGKDIENRSWPTDYRGPLAIHAGKAKMPEDMVQEIEDTYGVEVPRGQLVYGAIIGLVDLVDCVTSHPSKWFDGPYGFVLATPRPIKPVPMPGQLGLFTVRLPG
jgi:hypothetical protein